MLNGIYDTGDYAGVTARLRHSFQTEKCHYGKGFGYQIKTQRFKYYICQRSGRCDGKEIVQMKKYGKLLKI